MTDREHYFHGHEPRECGFHDSTGDRAWCSDCTEWCYEAIPCRGCELPSLRAEVEQLRDELWPVVAMRNGALNRAEAAEAKLAAVEAALDKRHNVRTYGERNTPFRNGADQMAADVWKAVSDIENALRAEIADMRENWISERGHRIGQSLIDEQRRRAEAAEAKLDEVRVALRAGGLTAAVRIHDALTILAAPAEADS